MKPPNLVDELAILHSDLCSCLADPHRILMIYMLEKRPLTVNDLAAEIGISQPATSRHLKILRDAGLVRAARQGQNVEYSLTDPRLVEALDLLRGVLHDRLTHHASLVEFDLAGSEE